MESIVPIAEDLMVSKTMMMEPLDTGHPHVRFIKGFYYNPFMDSQDNILFRNSTQPEHSPISDSPVSPLASGAKYLKRYSLDKQCKDCQKPIENRSVRCSNCNVKYITKLYHHKILHTRLIKHTKKF